MPAYSDEGNAPVVRVSQPRHHAQAFQPLDELGHRRLADPFPGRQRRKPHRPFTAHPVHGKRSRRAQVGAVGQKPRRQVRCLIEKLADADAGVFIGRTFSHRESISWCLYSDNRCRGPAESQVFDRNIVLHYQCRAVNSLHSRNFGRW